MTTQTKTKNTKIMTTQTPGYDCYCKGFDYSLTKEYEKAIEAYTSAIELGCKEVYVYKSRASAYENIGDYKEVLREVRAIISIDPQNTWAHVKQGLMYSQLKKYKEAIASFTNALQIDPTNTTAYFHRGIAYKTPRVRIIPFLKLRFSIDLQKALADFSKVVELDPKGIACKNVFFERGHTYEALGKLEEANADFKKDMEIALDYRR